MNTGTTSPGSDTYVAYAGTSMATPHVAAAAALMLSRNGTLTPDDIEARLKSSARALPGSCSGGCGAGIVNALAAVNAAGSGGGTPGACPTGFTLYSGTLSSGSSSYAPSSSGSAAAAGVHSGRLSGPATADFDIYLQRRTSTSWQTVAQGIGSTSTESVDYNGTANTYRWRDCLQWQRCLFALREAPVDCDDSSPGRFTRRPGEARCIADFPSLTATVRPRMLARVR